MLQYTAAWQKDRHSLTHTHTCVRVVVCLIAELDTELVEGRLMQKESASDESSFLFGCGPHIGPARALLKLSLPLTLPFSRSLSEITSNNDN